MYFDIVKVYFDMRRIHFDIVKVYFDTRRMDFDIVKVYFDMRRMYFDMRRMYFDIGRTNSNILCESPVLLRRSLTVRFLYVPLCK
jgi:hypothetical protein